MTPAAHNSSLQQLRGLVFSRIFFENSKPSFVLGIISNKSSQLLQAAERYAQASEPMYKNEHMKLFLLLLISAQTFAQLEVKDYAINVNDNEYDFTLLSYGKYSKTKLMKVLTCDKNDFEEVKEKVKQCYDKYKIESTDFYILPFDKTKDNESVIVESYLNKIDEMRMSESLSTIRIRFNQHYDKLTRSWKITYDLESMLELKEIENFIQNIEPAKVCEIISGRK